MKKLVCEMCGGANLIKQDGVFVCQNCGTKYSVEEAKKMMMEGIVSIEGTVSVDGVVKVDKSEELKKLYTLARRAKESDNTENAVRYYTEIEMQDPESWEAYFYLIYFRARTSKIGEIHKECKNLSNCFSTTFNLLKSSVHDSENHRSILRQIVKDVRYIGEIMMSSAKSISDLIDRVNYQASVLSMMESLGDSILKSFHEHADIAAEAWESELDAFISEVCYGKVDKDFYKFFTKGGCAGYVITDIPLKIYEIDPTYEDPFGIAKKLHKKGNLITCQSGKELGKKPNDWWNKNKIQLIIGIAILSTFIIVGIISNTTSSHDQINKQRTLSPTTHTYVDLGLSVKWATCNVGANKPEEYGDYFAWGEIEPKSYYDWNSYKWCKGSDNTQTKYCTEYYYGTVDNKTSLDLSDDAAHANWGGSWRMPTKAEQDELRANCTWTWVYQNGVYGYKVVSKKTGYTNKFIFLPAAGYYEDSDLCYTGSIGSFWSSSLDFEEPYSAGILYVTPDHVGRYNYCRRDYGKPVRPVCP